MVNVTIKVRSTFEDEINVSYIDSNSDFKYLRQHVADLFHFENSSFTIKFIDDEGDPCTISSENEFSEAIRLTLDTLEKEPELTLHVFAGVPAAPGLLCPGEDKYIYRRGAFRRKKLYHLNGHSFQPRRFNKLTSCVFCGDQIWGLGRQGFKCLKCKLMVHKKCHKLLQKACTGESETSHKSEPKPPLAHRVGTGRHFANQKKKPETTKSNENEQQVEELVQETGARPKLYSLDDFDLIRVIGRGSYAKVLLVELRETKRQYAMKVIKKELFADDEEIDWVQTEKHVYELATGCSFMVGLHSCFQTDSKLFFVIEFVNGGDLMFHMQRQRVLPEDHARFYAAEISLALNYLHERFIIYRDLKLDNVLLDQYGHIKLTDYGMCKEGIRPGETTSTFCGTPNYIAPEIIQGYDYSFSIDWWALGVLLYEMMIGQSPFDIIDGRKDGTDKKGETNEDILFKSIVTKKIYISRRISVKARNVLIDFLDKNPKTRLGCAPDGQGFIAIQNHPFFKSLDWDLLAEKKIEPPYVPKIENDLLEHFDPTFTKEPIQLTPPDLSIIDRIDQTEFEGFEFINPEIMTVEEAV